MLTVLFLVSYGLMTLLVVEQGSAIQSQRNLIQVLLRDSTELWGAKGKAIGDKRAAQAQKSGQTPSTQGQTPSAQVPSAQPKHSHGKVAQPPVPPVPASDWMDQRRALRTI